jgi:hypothetical protein
MEFIKVGNIEAQLNGSGKIFLGRWNATIVSPVTNSLQPGDWNFRGKPSTSR